MFPLAPRTLFLTLAGSQAHGTARDGSDVDLRGVCIAPLAVRLSLFGGFEQAEGPLEGALAAEALPRLRAHPTASRGLGVKTECVVFDVAKLVGLCAVANPNALEILFADEADWILERPAWRRLHAARSAFLTRKVEQTFSGYALAQLKKIRTHRSWLLDPPAARPTRAAFGLPEHGGTLSPDDRNRIEESLAEAIRAHGIGDIEMPGHTRIALEERLAALQRDVLGAAEDELEDRQREVAGRSLGLSRELLAALTAERRYRAAMKHWESYRRWQRERNPDRAGLERRHGYDTKHAMHLVRLMRMGLEALATGELRVRRPDAEELVAIRDGALPFDRLLEESARLQAEMRRAAAATALPEEVDRQLVDRLVLDLVLEAG